MIDCVAIEYETMSNRSEGDEGENYADDVDIDGNVDSDGPGGSTGIAFTDDELTALALAADPNTPIDDDATPFGRELSVGADLLPEWYMPVPQMSAADRTPRRVFTVSLIVFALLLLNGAGLCVTYGLPEIAW